MKNTKKKKQRAVIALLWLLCAFGGGLLGHLHRQESQRLAHAGKHLMMGSLAPEDQARLVQTSQVVAADQHITQTQKVVKRKRVAAVSGVPFPPAPSSQTLVTALDASVKAKIDLGFDVSHVYILPMARFSFALTRSAVIGVFASYVDNFSGQDVKAYGGGVTGAYFFEGTAYHGLMVDASLGAYKVEGRNAFRTSSASPIAVSSTVGWQGDLVGRVNLAISFGAQYAHNGDNTVGDVIFRGIMPLGKVGIGYSF